MSNTPMLIYALWCLFSIAACLAACSCAFYAMGVVCKIWFRITAPLFYACMLFVIVCGTGNNNYPIKTRAIVAFCLLLHFAFMFKVISTCMSKVFFFMSTQLRSASLFMYNWAINTTWHFRINLLTALLLAFATDFNNASYEKFMEGGNLIEILYAGFSAM